MHNPLTKAWCNKHQIPQSVRYLVWSIYDLSGESNSDPDPVLDMLPNEYIILKHLDGTFIEIHHTDELKLAEALRLIGT